KRHGIALTSDSVGGGATAVNQRPRREVAGDITFSAGKFCAERYGGFRVNDERSGVIAHCLWRIQAQRTDDAVDNGHVCGHTLCRCGVEHDRRTVEPYRHGCRYSTTQAVTRKAD